MQNDAQGPHPCPVCREPMIAHEVKGVALEVCNEHGTWLADDQLAQIVSRVQREAQTGASSARRRVRRLIRKRRKEREAKSGTKQASLVGALLSVLFS